MIRAVEKEYKVHGANGGIVQLRWARKTSQAP